MKRLATAQGTAKAVAIGAGYVVLDRRVLIRSVNVYSIANSRFRLAATSTKLTGPDQWPVLALDGTLWTAGRAGQRHLDRATATRLAAAYKIPVHRRTALDAGLRYAWTIPPTATTTVQLRVENAGQAIVGFTVGGRQRGARDNRFAFTVARDGAALPIKEAPDFGGFRRAASDPRSVILDRQGRAR